MCFVIFAYFLGFNMPKMSLQEVGS